MLIIQNVSIENKKLTVVAASHEVISSEYDVPPGAPVPTMVLELDFGNGDVAVPMGIPEKMVSKIDTPVQMFLGAVEDVWTDIPDGIEEINLIHTEVVVNNGKTVYNKYTSLLAEADPFHKYRVRKADQESDQD